METSTKHAAPQRIPFGAPVIVYDEDAEVWQPGRISGTSGTWYYVMLDDGSDEPLAHPSLVLLRGEEQDQPEFCPICKTVRSWDLAAPCVCGRPWVNKTSIAIDAYSPLPLLARSLAFFPHAERIECGRLRVIDAEWGPEGWTV